MDTMNQEAFKKWTDITNHIQQPLQALTELNVKTLQNFKYIKPDELTSIKKPEDLLNKQMTAFIENGHNTLDYMKKSFSILENMVLFMYDEGKDSGISASNPMAAMQMAESTLLHSSNLISDVTNTVAPTLEKAAQSIMKPVVDHSIQPPETNKKIMPTIKASAKKTKAFSDKNTSKYPADDKPWDIKK